MATLTYPASVLELLDELGADPLMRVYRTRHRVTQQECYTVFFHPSHDALVWAPEVEEVVLLWEAGQPTEAGRVWRAEHQSIHDAASATVELTDARHACCE